MTAWTVQPLDPAEAATEPFEFDDEDRLELDGGTVVTLGTRPDGTPAVMIQCPSLVLFAIFGAFLGGITILSLYWPVLLILLGLIILAQGFFRKRQS